MVPSLPLLFFLGAPGGAGFLLPLGSCSFYNPLLVPFLQPRFLLAVVSAPVLAGAHGARLVACTSCCLFPEMGGCLLGFFCPVATGECSLRSFYPVAAAHAGTPAAPVLFWGP